MPDKTDISGKVFLTPTVVEAWKSLGQATVQALGRRFKREDVGEEIITLNPDGKTLTVSCKLGDGEMTMVIPEGQWSYLGYAQ